MDRWYSYKEGVSFSVRIKAVKLKIHKNKKRGGGEKRTHSRSNFACFSITAESPNVYSLLFNLWKVVVIQQKDKFTSRVLDLHVENLGYQLISDKDSLTLVAGPKLAQNVAHETF